MSAFTDLITNVVMFYGGVCKNVDLRPDTSSSQYLFALYSPSLKFMEQSSNTEDENIFFRPLPIKEVD